MTNTIIGTSPAIQRVRDLIAKAAPSRGRVLITGENGTGKELIARAIHEQSSRADAPYVTLNCAAVPAELIESELFGHERGAFTGAVTRHAGKFEQAHGGTLFLDEVGDMPASMQAKLLRVLQTGEVTPVGATKTKHYDVRIVAATNCDLAADVAMGKFREDLYYRLNVIHIKSPALRDRAEDIPELLQHFITVSARENEAPVPTIAADALAALSSRAWRGNVRELQNVAERIVVLGASEVVTLSVIDSLTPEGPLMQYVQKSAARHGTVYNYTKGCRCDACRAANATARRVQRQRNKERLNNAGRDTTTVQSNADGADNHTTDSI